MSDSLTISGGGSVRVTTTAMTARADRLSELLNEATRWSLAVTNSGAATRSADAPLDASVAGLGIRLNDIGARCSVLSGDLDRAAVDYGEAEERARLFAVANGGGSDVIAGVWERMQDPLSRDRVFGWFSRHGWEHLSWPAGLASIATLAALLKNPSTREPLVARLMMDGTVIDIIRWASEHVDDAGRLFFPVEWTVATLIAAPGRPPGPQQSAAVVAMLLTLAGVLARAPRYRAQARPVPSGGPAVAPRGFGDLERGLPEDAQLGVQRIGDEYVVYLRGTEDFELNPEVPFDMRSNIELLGGQDSASVQATLDAMRQAEVPPGARVTFVGHSQGAMVAAQIARSGRFQVHDIVSFGGPILQVDLPADTRVISFEHNQDVVPAAGGIARGAENEPQVLRVRRELDPADLADLSGGVLPAHGLTNYRATADLADASTDERLERYRRDLLQRFAGPAGEVEYFAVRGVPALSPGGGGGGGGR